MATEYSDGESSVISPDHLPSVVLPQYQMANLALSADHSELPPVFRYNVLAEADESIHNAAIRQRDLRMGKVFIAGIFY
jgi:hypothetical protein